MLFFCKIIRSFILKWLFFVVLFYRNVCLFKELHRKFVGVAVFKDDALYTAVDYHFGADDARLVGAVQGCFRKRNAESCRLNDGVLFGVDGVTKFVACSAWNVENATHTFLSFDATFYPCRRAVVAGSQNTFVFYDDSAYLAVFLIAT